jgi:hypothetical protein
VLVGGLVDGFADVSGEYLAALGGGVDPPVRPPETWLARVAWRRRGLVRAGEGPRQRPSART